MSCRANVQPKLSRKNSEKSGKIKESKFVCAVKSDHVFVGNKKQERQEEGEEKKRRKSVVR
jgi:hypothetical protein